VTIPVTRYAALRVIERREGRLNDFTRARTAERSALTPKRSAIAVFESPSSNRCLSSTRVSHPNTTPGSEARGTSNVRVLRGARA
jgi:hypothetical protein